MLEFLNSRLFEYVSWKNNHELTEVLSGRSDLDILVRGVSEQHFDDLASAAGWIKFENRLARFPHVAHYFRCDGERIFHIHTYFQVVTGESWIKEFLLPLDDFLFDRSARCAETGINVLVPEAQALVFLLRHFLKNGSFSSRLVYARELDSYRREWASLGVDVSDVSASNLFPINTWAPKSGLCNGFEQPSFMAARAFRRSMRRYLRFKLPVLSIRRLWSFSRRFANKALLQRRKSFAHSGVVVALSGADGVGKSTMLGGLVENFSVEFDCRTVSLGKPQSFLIQRLQERLSPSV